VDTAGILDLCQPEILVAARIEPGRRFADWKTTLLIEQRRPASWDTVDRLIAAGLNGSLVSSTRLPGGRNLVLWRWNDAPVRGVIAIDPQSDLPQDQSSWPVAPPTRLR
jgi:RES domain-containing protein